MSADRLVAAYLSDLVMVVTLATKGRPGRSTK